MSAAKTEMLLMSILFLFGGTKLVSSESGLSLSLPAAGSKLVKGVVYGFFDDTSGDRVGQMRVGSVDVEYRRQGFMRVAWRPLVVLSNVGFDFSDNVNWPAKGLEIGRDLVALGGHEEFILRTVRFKMGGKFGCEIVAASARLLPRGILEFDDLTLSSVGGEARVLKSARLILTGPDAGRLITGAAQGDFVKVD